MKSATSIILLPLANLPGAREGHSTNGSRRESAHRVTVVASFILLSK
jgi:hypothetical protein